MKFSSEQKYPINSILISFPILILVIGFGFIQQSAAIGISLFSINYLYKNQLIKYSILILIAWLIHSSAIIMMIFPLVLINKKQRLIQVLLFCFLFYLIYESITSQIDHYIYGYLDKNRKSSGLLPRLSLGILASILFYSKFRSYSFSSINEKKVLKIFAISPLILLISLFFLSSTTAVDRILFYTFPIQIYTYSNIGTGVTKPYYNSFILFVINLFITVIWLLYSSHSYCWMNYDNLLLYFF